MNDGQQSDRLVIVILGAHAVLSAGMSPAAAAKLPPRNIPTQSYWSDSIQEAVVKFLMDHGMKLPDLPIEQMIAAVAARAKTRDDNRRLAIRRRRQTLEENAEKVMIHWPLLSASDLFEDICRLDRRNMLIREIVGKTKGNDRILFLTILREGIPDAQRAAELGFPTTIDYRNAMRRIATAAKAALRSLRSYEHD